MVVMGRKREKQEENMSLIRRSSLKIATKNCIKPQMFGLE